MKADAAASNATAALDGTASRSLPAIDRLYDDWRPRGPGQCRTRYPVVLLHGLGFRDDLPFVSSWGRIPTALRDAGCKVLLGEVDAWGSIESNARQLKARVLHVLDECRAEKVNLIAHSKGGLEARYAMCILGLADRVSSLTTVCTPHRGTSAADAAIELPTGIQGIFSKLVDIWGNLSGDRTPEARKAVRELSRPSLDEFNRLVRDPQAVFCQSLGSAVRTPFDDPFFTAASLVIQSSEGANDGIVPVTSCAWGTFRGILQSKDSRRGLSHRDMVDFHKREISGIDIPRLYLALVEELAQSGH